MAVCVRRLRLTPQDACRHSERAQAHTPLHPAAAPSAHSTRVHFLFQHCRLTLRQLFARRHLTSPTLALALSRLAPGKIHRVDHSLPRRPLCSSHHPTHHLHHLSQFRLRVPQSRRVLCMHPTIHPMIRSTARIHRHRHRRRQSKARSPRRRRLCLQMAELCNRCSMNRVSAMRAWTLSRRAIHSGPLPATKTPS